MALTTPALPEVSPGEPITAQGWNGLRSATLTLFDAFNAFGQGVLLVKVQANGVAVQDAAVVALPDAGGPAVEAVPPFADRTSYEVNGVADGNWTVHVAAFGFKPKVTPVTIPRAEPLVVELEPIGTVMPDLYGLLLRDALAGLRAVNLTVERILDALGHDVAPAAPAVEHQTSPVLAQHPPAGTPLDPATARLRLVVAAAVREQPVVTMPALLGLTQAEAARVLGELGLRLGDVKIV
jgi:hypothetical protein